MRRIGLVLAFGLAGLAPAAAQYYGDDRPPFVTGPYGVPYGDYGPYYAPRNGWDAGVADVAICPPGYHLGRHGRLCWPNR